MFHLIEGGLDYILSSTEIIDLVPPFTARSTVSMNLNTARLWFGMTFVGGDFNALVAVGGYNRNDDELATLETFDPLTETWTNSNTTLKQGRYGFGTLAVTAETLGCSG